MKIIVLKFGGTSVGSILRIKKVAKIIKSYLKNYKVIVLSSAMSGTTNNLINMSKKISNNFSAEEYDTLVALKRMIHLVLCLEKCHVTHHIHFLFFKRIVYLISHIKIYVVFK